MFVLVFYWDFKPDTASPFKSVTNDSSSQAVNPRPQLMTRRGTGTNQDALILHVTCSVSAQNGHYNHFLILRVGSGSIDIIVSANRSDKT